MRKLLINLVMLILAFTIQICVFPQIAFLSSAPNLLLIVVFVCSFIEGRERGMFYGLVAGLFMDLFYSGPFGFYTLFFINLGYVATSFAILELKYAYLRFVVRNRVSISGAITRFICASCSSYSKSVIARRPRTMTFA